MNNITLMIMAAGMGSRYGGLKQLDSVGPNGETIIDYSVYDAIEAGFNKVVFIIRKDFENDFKSKNTRRAIFKIYFKILFNEFCEKISLIFSCKKSNLCSSNSSWFNAFSRYILSNLIS